MTEFSKTDEIHQHISKILRALRIKIKPLPGMSWQKFWQLKTTIKAPEDKRQHYLQRNNTKTDHRLLDKNYESQRQCEEILQVKDKKMTGHLEFFTQCIYPLKLNAKWRCSHTKTKGTCHQQTRPAQNDKVKAFLQVEWK